MLTRLVIYLGYYALNVVFASDPLAVALTAPLMVIVVWQVVQIRDRYFTLWDMVNFLVYLFFVIEPLQVVDHGRIGTDGPVSAAIYANGQIVIAMGIATMFCGIVLTMVHAARRRPATVKFFRVDGRYSMLLLALFAVAFLAYVYFIGGFRSLLLSRWGRVEAATSSEVDATAAFIAIMAGTMTGIAFVMASQCRARLDLAALCFVPVTIVLLVCFNPFNTSRFSLISTYLPLGFVLARGRIRALPVYAAAMVGIVVLMPILSISTRFGLAGLSARDIADANILHLQFVDAFDILVECVRYVEVHGVADGVRLLADIVAYVPRSMWPGKPVIGAIDVGQGLVDVGYFGTSNVSQLVAADGYMDFGFLGVALVSLLVGAYLILVFVRRQTLVNGHPLVCYAFVAALPILIRGPITSVVSIFLFQSLSILAIRKSMGTMVTQRSRWRPSGLGVEIETTARRRPRRVPSPATARAAAGTV